MRYLIIAPIVLLLAVSCRSVDRKAEFFRLFPKLERKSFGFSRKALSQAAEHLPTLLLLTEDDVRSLALLISEDQDIADSELLVLTAGLCRKKSHQDYILAHFNSIKLRLMKLRLAAVLLILRERHSDETLAFLAEALKHNENCSLLKGMAGGFFRKLRQRVPALIEESARKSRFLRSLSSLDVDDDDGKLTDDAVKKLAGKLPQLLSLAEEDVAKMGSLPGRWRGGESIWFFADMAGILGRLDECQDYVLKHFSEIQHRQLRLAWSVGLLFSKRHNEATLTCLSMALTSVEDRAFLCEWLGPSEGGDFALLDMRSRLRDVRSEN